MYVFPVGNQALLLDRDEKRVGKYIDLERVPAPIRVSHDVRRISVTKIDLFQENIEKRILEKNTNEITEEWLGKNVDIRI